MEGEDGSMSYDPDVHSQQDLTDQGKSGTYRGEQGSAIDENTGEAIYYNADGSTTRETNRLAESTITPSGGYQTSNPSIGTNNNTGHIYNDRDLAVRSSILSTDNPIARFIKSREAKGNFGILNSHDYWMTYGHTMGNLMLADAYIIMALDVTGGTAGPLLQTTLSPNTSSPSTWSLPVPSSQLLLPQRSTVPRNSWNAFLKKSSGRYTGSNWQRQAAEDYRNQ